MFNLLRASLLAIATATPTAAKEPATEPSRATTTAELSRATLAVTDIDLDEEQRLQSDPAKSQPTIQDLAKAQAERTGVPLTLGINSETKKVEVLYRDSSKVSDQELQELLKVLNEKPATVEKMLAAVQNESQLSSFKRKELDDKFTAIPLDAKPKTTDPAPAPVVSKTFEIRMANDALGNNSSLTIDSVKDAELYKLATTPGLQIKCTLDSTGIRSFEISHYDILQSRFEATDANWKEMLTGEIKGVSLTVGTQPQKLDLSKLTPTQLIEEMSRLDAANAAAEREVRMKNSLADKLSPPAQVKDATQEANRRHRAATDWERDQTNGLDRTFNLNRELPLEQQNRQLADQIKRVDNERVAFSRDVERRACDVAVRQENLRSRIRIDKLDDWLKELGDKGQVIIDGNTKDAGSLKKDIQKFLCTNYAAAAQKIVDNGDGQTRVYLASPDNQRYTCAEYVALSPEELRQRVQERYDRSKELHVDQVNADARLKKIGLTSEEKAALRNVSSGFKSREETLYDRQEAAQACQLKLLAQWTTVQTGREYARQAKNYLECIVQRIDAPTAEREYNALRNYYNSNQSLGGKATGNIEGGIKGGVDKATKKIGKKIEDAIGGLIH